jgi:hypothetical protein
MRRIEFVEHALHERFPVRTFPSGGFAQGPVHAVAKFL